MNIFKKTDRPKYRAVPDASSGWLLQQWDDNLKYYSSESYMKTLREAETRIKNLERRTVYYSEDGTEVDAK
jgi:hypothetical protein